MRLLMKIKCGYIDERPWGLWKLLDIGKGFQVKKIIVLSNKRLSLQSHQFRTEHWVVISGVAQVELEKQSFSLSKGKHIDIPAKAKHRLGNKGSNELVLIETQFGNYLGEDDIIRYEDDFGRT